MSGTEPRYPLEGVVSWNMNTTCNFRCSYCTQRFVDDRRQWAKDLPGFIQGFVALPGDWEVKLSGGEPFRHPGFVDAVQQLADGGLRVSVVSNFSADRAQLQAFAEATQDRPGVFSASLHLEWVEPAEFFEKARWFQEIFAGRFCVTLVATAENWPKIPALQALWPELKLQPEKQDRDVVAYTPAQRQQL
ncbi:MAG: organic radical activating enzyme, partial [Cognaticolwellia sp.]